MAPVTDVRPEIGVRPGRDNPLTNSQPVQQDATGEAHIL